MGSMASQITSFAIVYSAVYSGADQRKHQSSASLAFERGIHRGPVNSPHKWPVMRKMLPFDDVIVCWNFNVSIFKLMYKEFLPTASLVYISMAIRYAFVLYRRHLSIIMSHITGISTVWSTDSSGKHRALRCRKGHSNGNPSMSSNTENVSMLRRHHDKIRPCG